MNPATLAIRRVGIDTWRESVVFLHRDCPVVRAEGFDEVFQVVMAFRFLVVAQHPGGPHDIAPVEEL